MRIALDNSYVETAIRAYRSLGWSLPYEEGERSLEYHEKGYELAKKVGAIHYQSLLGANLSARYFFLGDISKSKALIIEPLALLRKAGNMPSLYRCLITQEVEWTRHMDKDYPDNAEKER